MCNKSISDDANHGITKGPPVLDRSINKKKITDHFRHTQDETLWCQIPPAICRIRVCRLIYSVNAIPQDIT